MLKIFIFYVEGIPSGLGEFWPKHLQRGRKMWKWEHELLLKQRCLAVYQVYIYSFFCGLFSSCKLTEAVSGSEILLSFNFKIKWDGCGLLPLYVGEFMCHCIAPTLVIGSAGHQITKDWRQTSGRKLGLPPWIKGHGNDKMTWIFLPLTKRFGNARLESQKYTTFPVVLFEFLWKIRNVQNGSPVFVVGMCQMEITHL